MKLFICVWTTAASVWLSTFATAPLTAADAPTASELFKVDDAGAPIAYVRQSRDNEPIQEPTAVGRLMCAAAVPDDRPLRLTVLGQALIAHDLREHPYPGLDELTRDLKQADVCFSNLETAIRSDGAGKPTKSGLYLHTAEPVVLDCLRDMGVNLLSLSNNHTGDLGSEGVLAAIREVRQRGFIAGGSGANLDEAAAPVYLKTSQGTVAMVAMASNVASKSTATADLPGANHLTVRAGKLDATDAERNLNSIRQAAAKADYVLVYQHNHYWENDNRRTPEWQRAWARACIDAGATLFVGHGVPLMHGIEIYRGRPIFYCLGNFVFHTRTPPGHYPTAVWQSVVADCYLSDGDVVELKLRAVRLTEGERGDDFLKTRGRPRFAVGDEAETILADVQRLSDPYGTVMQRTGDEVTVRLAPSK